MPTTPEPSTTIRTKVAGLTAFAAIAAVILESAVDLVPDDPIIGYITPLRLLIAIGLIALVVLKPRPAHWFTILDAPLLALAVLSYLSVRYTSAPGYEFRLVITGIAIYYLVIGFRRLTAGSQPVMGHLAMVALIPAVGVALQQAANQTSTGFCRAALDGTRESCADAGAMVRVIGTHTNPNLLAAFLLLLTPIAALTLVRTRFSQQHAVTYLVLVGAVVALIFTFSRNALLAAIAAVCTYLILKNPTRKRLTIGGTIGSLAVVGALWIFHTGATLGIRESLYAMSARIIREHPNGVGLGRAGSVLQVRFNGEHGFAHAHNLWLNWLMETGPVGLLVWIAIPLLTGYVVLRAALQRRADAPLIAASLIGFWIAGLADHPSNAARISWAMWIVLGMASASLSAPRFRRDTPEESQPPGRSTHNTSNAGILGD